MEANLDRLLDFDTSGDRFPQFADTWEEAYAAARGACDSACAAVAVASRLRVAIATVDPRSFCAAFLAFARCEADIYLFNPSWGRSEHEAGQALSRPHLIVGDFVSGAFDLREQFELPKQSSEEEEAQGMRVMIATGGTSGKLRFAIHNWSSLAAATVGLQRHFECDRISAHCVLPLYHVSGFMQLVRALLTNGKVVFGRADTFSEDHRMLEAAPVRERFVSLVATQLERLVRDVETREVLRSYRAVFVGGGPTRIGLLEECRVLGIPLAPTYGMTETAAQVATLQPEAFLRGESSQGRALPHARIDLVDEADGVGSVTVGRVGLIRIGGPSLFLGYVGETSAMREGAIVTSDLGVFDRDGNLTVLGRADHVIICGGEKVNLREIEIASERTDLVKDVVAFGVNDKEWGEKLALAYVAKEPFVTEEALRSALAKELASYKVPKVWIRKEELPRNKAGKLRLAELRDAVDG